MTGSKDWEEPSGERRLPVDEITRGVMEAWPDDTEFVILRKVDWRRIREALSSEAIAVLDDMQLVPLELEIPEEDGDE